MVASTRDEDARSSATLSKMPHAPQHIMQNMTSAFNTNEVGIDAALSF